MENEWQQLFQQALAKQSEVQCQQHIQAMQLQQQEQLARMRQAIERDVMEKVKSQLHEQLSVSSRQAKSSATKAEQDPEEDTVSE